MFELDANSVTQILADFSAGDRMAAESLLPKVYSELRRLAATHLDEDRGGHTLQPTELVHEAYLKLTASAGATVSGRVHFFRLASKLMRQILIDHARARGAAKRGGDRARVTLDGVSDLSARPDVDILALEQALKQLDALSPRKARLVELRFFGGLTEEQAAEVLSISRTQAAREWRTARAWLADELEGKQGGGAAAGVENGEQGGSGSSGGIGGVGGGGG